MVQQKVVTLLSDPENIVKQTLMENGITRLCVFFGRQKANDVLLSHMITFLNDKNDWHLRGAFFDSIVGELFCSANNFLIYLTFILKNQNSQKLLYHLEHALGMVYISKCIHLSPLSAGVAAYVGWQSSSILKPLLQQGLSDVEEFVIYKALNALTCMCQLGLLQKTHIYEFVSDIGERNCLCLY